MREAMGWAEAFFEGVKWGRSDVTKDDAKGGDRGRGERKMSVSLTCG